MSTSELTETTLKLLDFAESLEKRVRLYDGTLRFVRVNNPKMASDFEADMAVVSLTPDLVDSCVSPELDALGQQLRQLVVQIAQDLSKHSKH